jgi:transposase
MEDILDVYTRPYDARYPQVCMDEKPVQLIEETRTPLPAKPGRRAREDFEYKRNGTSNLFMFFEPLAGQRHVMVTATRTTPDWAEAIRQLVDEIYPTAERIVLVLDNLNIHRIASLYETFAPEEARRIARRLELHYTPRHGSWLNMAEIELSVLSRQCLDRRIPTQQLLTSELSAWQQQRNAQGRKVNWRFTSNDARIKLKRLYPSIEP